MMFDLLFNVLGEATSLLSGYPLLLLCVIAFGIVCCWTIMLWPCIADLKLWLWKKRSVRARPDFFRFVEIAEAPDNGEEFLRSYLKINCKVLNSISDEDLKYLTEAECRFVKWYRRMLSTKPTSMFEFALAYDEYPNLMDKSQMDICAVILEMYDGQVKKDA